MKNLTFRVSGVAPLVMHNGQMANPLNRYAKQMKAITSKRKKTDDDHLEMARIEFLGSLYLGEDGAPIIPSEVIEATIVAGAKATRKGKAAKQAIYVQNNAKLEYDGPKTADELWADDRFPYYALVRVQAARVNRCRPRFNNWSCEFTVSYDDSILNPSEVVEFVQAAGLAGFCDGRPRFGRFEIVDEAAKKAAA